MAKGKQQSQQNQQQRQNQDGHPTNQRTTQNRVPMGSEGSDVSEDLDLHGDGYPRDGIPGVDGNPVRYQTRSAVRGEQGTDDTEAADESGPDKDAESLSTDDIG